MNVNDLSGLLGNLASGVTRAGHSNVEWPKQHWKQSVRWISRAMDSGEAAFFCAGVAQYVARSLTQFGLQSATLSLAVPSRLPLSHVVTLVRHEEQYFAFDPWFMHDFADETGQMIPLAEFMKSFRKSPETFRPPFRSYPAPIKVKFEAGSSSWLTKLVDPALPIEEVEENVFIGFAPSVSHLDFQSWSHWGDLASAFQVAGLPQSVASFFAFPSGITTEDGRWISARHAVQVDSPEGELLAELLNAGNQTRGG